ncbi:hypothetical protein [Massilia sp. BKSP1R2A-1]|uniref:hypothetical protein n=1 Tax=Massilia sp. BKSP1R2A-1 TaxID=3422595 RepID=UPI003D34A8A0
MQRFILAAALSLAAGPSLAADITCDKPEYLQLKTADRAELTEEYCRSKKKFDQVLKAQADLAASISRQIAQGVDVTSALAEKKESLDAGMSCSKASADYMGALERRFKQRHRPACE